MGGRAQTIFLTTNKGEQKFNRCYFSEDGSFVDLGTLWSHQTRIELEKPSKSNQPAGVKTNQPGGVKTDQPAGVKSK